MPQPVIGISAHTGPVRVAIFDLTATFAAEIFVNKVAAAGCLPVLLPPLPDIERTADRLDGLLLLAGPDVDPDWYAEKRHSMTRGVNRARDSAELALLAAALDIGLPLLGVCRGMQLLNVLRGGTLHQHLPEIVGHEEHLPGPELYGPQPVDLAPGSGVARALRSGTAVVPCHHHQGIDRLGTGLVVTARAADGTIEAIEVPDHPFAIGVQWHAEQSEEDHLFRALAAAAAVYQGVRYSNPSL